jgi:hypothetical protein
LFEILLVALRSHLTFSLLDGFAPYARAVVVGVLILGCVVHAILTQQVNAQIIYQAF